MPEQQESRLERSIRENKVNEDVSRIMCSIVLKEGEKLKRPSWHREVYGGCKKNG